MLSTRIRIPKTLQWVINLFGIFVLIFTLFRVITFFAFHPSDITFSQALPAFLLGLRYDLRWIAIVLLPIVLLSSYAHFLLFILNEIKRHGHFI